MSMMDEAQALFDSGHLGRAEEIYHHELSQDPGNAQALFMLALVRRQQGKVDEAIDFMRQASEQDPENAHVLFNLGTLQASVRRFEDAREAYIKAVQIDPFNVAAHNGLAFAELGLGNWGAAENAANMALAEDSENAQALMYLGSAKLEQGDVTKAISYLQAALKSDPEHQSAQLLLGRAFLEAENHAFAMQAFENVLKHNPNLPQAWDFYGRALAGAGHFADASQSFRRALQLGYRTPAVVRALAEAERAMGNEDVAEEILQTAADPKPNRTPGDFVRVSSMLARGNPRGALELLQSYEGFEADMMRASAYEQARDFESAIAMVEKHLESEELSDAARLSYARVLAKAGRQEESDAIVDEMMAREEPPVHARIFHGFRLCRADDPAGLAVLREVEQEGQVDEVELRRVRRIMAQFLDRQGQFDEAAEYYRLNAGRLASSLVIGGSVARDNRDFLDDEVPKSLAQRQPDEALPADPIFVFAWPGSAWEWLTAGVGANPGVLAVVDKPETQVPRRGLITKPAGPEVLSSLDPDQAQGIVQAYWQNLSEGGLEPQGRQTLDAMWLSADMLPTLATLFPAARILVVRRDPGQMVLEWFRAGYSDLAEMAECYRDQLALLEAYRAWLPLEFIEASGEALTEGPHDEVRRVAEVLGLGWEAVMGDYLDELQAATRPYRGTVRDYEDVLEAPLGILGAAPANEGGGEP